jgi:5-methylcytosine-specific restriction endonuclease McrA
MPFKNVEERRRYQRKYYRSMDQRKKRATASNAYRERRRARIYERDNHTCFYCRKQKDPKFLQLDHVNPVNRRHQFRPSGKSGSDFTPGTIRVGRKSDDEYRTACRACNVARSNRPVCSECRMWTQPTRQPDGTLLCVECGSVSTFPEGTRAVNDAPEWIDEQSPAEDDGDDLRYA